MHLFIVYILCFVTTLGNSSVPYVALGAVFSLHWTSEFNSAGSDGGPPSLVGAELTLHPAPLYPAKKIWRTCLRGGAI